MGTPTSTTTAIGNIAATSHDLNIPAVAAGDAAIMIISFYSQFATVGTITPPANWTEVQRDNGPNVEGQTIAVYKHKAAAPAAATTADWATQNACKAASICWLIGAADWEGDIANVECTSTVVEEINSTNPDPPSISPSWGTDAPSFFFPTISSVDHIVTATAAPSGYDGLVSISSDTDSLCSAHSAYKQATAASENPGTFTLSTQDHCLTHTIAVKGAAAAAGIVGRLFDSPIFASPIFGR